MKKAIDATVNCRLVGDYVDEAEAPTDLAPQRSEVLLTEFAAEYEDIGGNKDNGDKDFTVLLRDNRAITVRGHGLQYLPNASNPTEGGSYGVLGHTGEKEVLVALFRVSEVTGIFSGMVQTPPGNR